MSYLVSSIERLESRIAPAVLFQVGDFDGDGIAHDLRITGGAGKERIQIEDTSTTTRLFIDANSDGDFDDPTDTDNQLYNFPVQQLEINLGGGNDSVSVNQLGNYTSPKSFIVNLGSGNNEFHFAANNSAINPNVPARFDITGGAQNDYLDMQFRDTGGLLSITAQLGGGIDGQLSEGKISGPSKIRFTGVTLGAHIDADVDLGTGSNRFLLDLDCSFGGFNVTTAANFRITGSSVASHKDDVTVAISGTSLDSGGKVRVTTALGAGNDAFHALISGNLALANSLAANEDGAILSLEVDGGAGNDRLEVQRTGAASTIELDGLFEVNFRGGAGNDTLIGDFSTTSGGTQFTTFSDDSEQRGLRLIFDGGLGNDAISATVANTNVATFVYDLALLGASGNDTLTFTGANNSGAPTYGPAGGALVDGGAGADTVTVTAFGGFAVKKYL